MGLPVFGDERADAGREPTGVTVGGHGHTPLPC